MNYLVSLSVLLTLLCGSIGVEVNSTEVLQMLVDKKFRKFQLTLTDLLADSDVAKFGKRVYPIILNNIMRSQKDKFVVLEGVLGKYTLIPQCCGDIDHAIMLEYIVLPTLKYKDPPTKVRQAAHRLLEDLERNNCAQVVSSFLHVKEVIKLGIAFYNRTLISVQHQSESTNF